MLPDPVRDRCIGFHASRGAGWAERVEIEQWLLKIAAGKWPRPRWREEVCGGYLTTVVLLHRNSQCRSNYDIVGMNYDVTSAHRVCYDIVVRNYDVVDRTLKRSDIELRGDALIKKCTGWVRL